MEQLSVESSSEGLLTILEKHVATLKVETNHVLQFSNDAEHKIEWFNKTSHELMDKLQSLWSLAETHCQTNVKVKEFADEIFRSWTLMNKQVCKQYSKMQVASRTLPSVPLFTLLKKIKKEAALISIRLQISEKGFNHQHKLKSSVLLNQIAELICNLEKYNEKVQRYLIASRMVSYFSKLELAINRFVSTEDLLTIKENGSSSLNTFLYVCKLLTGELLDNDIVDPHCVLSENTPKKPVFIIKSNKRKLDTSTLSTLKVINNS